MANITLSYFLPPCCSLLLEFIEIKINTNSIFKKQNHISSFTKSIFLCFIYVNFLK